ncbi:MAG: uroporphyrinogen decarboxylase family protein [Promethearchaeota archaeon]
MKSYERVKAALKFSDPDRIPIMNFMNLKTIVFDSDVFPMGAFPSSNYNPGFGEGEEGFYPRTQVSFARAPVQKWRKLPEWKNKQEGFHLQKDEWGCIWEYNPAHHNLGHPGEASLKNWEDLDSYMEKWEPNPDEARRYRLMGNAAQLIANNKYRMPIIDSPAYIAGDMVGFLKFLTEHHRNPDMIRKLLKIITDNIIQTMRNWKNYGNVHGFLMYEDLGEQDRTFMSVKMYRKFYEEVHGRIFQAAHDLGCDMHMHSCGKVDPYIPTWIEWGLDAIEFDSPRMCGYSDLKPFQGKIMFWGCVNIQTIYTHSPPDDVTREVWHMIRNLGTPHGGFGAYYYPQWKDIRVPKKNVRAFRKGLKKFGKYALIPLPWWEKDFIGEWGDYFVPPLPDDK